MTVEVSLVLAAWNPRRDWLLEAVASALAEQEVRLELIVVDDGSEIPVGELLAEVEDERLRVLRVPHGGDCLLYTSPSPRDRTRSRMPSSA